MISHFKGIKFQDGAVDIKIPNSLFKTLSTNIKSEKGRANSLQISFTYSYLVSVAFLYRYAYFVDIDNGTYIQNGDIKELLGYSRSTKSVNRIIKSGGIIDELNLTKTTSDYPITYVRSKDETINNIPLIEYFTISDLDEGSQSYNLIKDIVKNRNYEIKEPIFLTTEFDDNEYGTSYSLEKTHSITIDEFITFIESDDLDNNSFMVYAYLKSICKGLEGNRCNMALDKIVGCLGMDKSVFYSHLNILKKRKYIDVIHKEWTMNTYDKKEANLYIWKGINSQI